MRAGGRWLVSEVELRHALGEPRKCTIGLRRHTLRLSSGIGHKLAATSHILVSFFDTPCSRGSCGRRPWCDSRDMSAEGNGTRCRFFVLCMAQHDAYIRQPHPRFHGIQPQDIKDAYCAVSQLGDGPIICCIFLRSARRIPSLHSSSESNSPHRDALCDFALSHDIFVSSEYQAVSQ